MQKTCRECVMMQKNQTYSMRELCTLTHTPKLMTNKHAQEQLFLEIWVSPLKLQHNTPTVDIYSWY